MIKYVNIFDYLYRYVNTTTKKYFYKHLCIYSYIPELNSPKKSTKVTEKKTQHKNYINKTTQHI